MVRLNVGAWLEVRGIGKAALTIVEDPVLRVAELNKADTPMKAVSSAAKPRK